jgi:hypothetical protein
MLEFNLNEHVVISPTFKKFLKFRNPNNVYKYNFLLNYLLCNYFMEEYDENHIVIKFIMNNKLRNFLRQYDNYYGCDYSLDGVKNLLNNYVKKEYFEIEI